MPCYYCGKRVSLVRQISDGDFCSDDHRKRYHELTKLALNRLVKAQNQLATASHAVKSGGKGPVNGTAAPAAVQPIAPPVPPPAAFLAQPAHDPRPPSRAAPVPIAEELRPGVSGRLGETAIQSSAPAMAAAELQTVAPAARTAVARPRASSVPLPVDIEGRPATRSLPLGTPAPPILAIEAAGMRVTGPLASSVEAAAHIGIAEPAAVGAALPSAPLRLATPALPYAAAAESRFTAGTAGSALRQAPAEEFSATRTRLGSFNFTVIEEARQSSEAVPEPTEAILAGPPAAIAHAAEPLPALVEFSPAALVRGTGSVQAPRAALQECGWCTEALEGAAEGSVARIAGEAFAAGSLRLAACAFGVVDERAPAASEPACTEVILAGPPAAIALAAEPVPALVGFSPAALVRGTAPAQAPRAALSMCGLFAAEPQAAPESGVAHMAEEAFAAVSLRLATCAFGVVAEGEPASEPEPAEAIFSGPPAAIAPAATPIPALVEFSPAALVRGSATAQAARSALPVCGLLAAELEGTAESGVAYMAAEGFAAVSPRLARCLFGVVEEDGPAPGEPAPAEAILTGTPAVIVPAAEPVAAQAEFSPAALAHGSAPAPARHWTIGMCDVTFTLAGVEEARPSASAPEPITAIADFRPVTPVHGATAAQAPHRALPAAGALPAALGSSAGPGLPDMADGEDFPVPPPRTAACGFGVADDSGPAGVPEPAEAILAGPPVAIAIGARPIAASDQFAAPTPARGALPAPAWQYVVPVCEALPERLEGSGGRGRQRVAAGEPFTSPPALEVTFDFARAGELGRPVRLPEAPETIRLEPSAIPSAAVTIPARTEFSAPPPASGSTPRQALGCVLSDGGPVAEPERAANAPGRPRSAAGEALPIPEARFGWRSGASATNAPGPADAIGVRPAAQGPSASTQAIMRLEMPGASQPALPGEWSTPSQPGRALETAGMRSVAAATPFPGVRAAQAVAAPAVAPHPIAVPGTLESGGPETTWHGAALVPEQRPCATDRRCERSAVQDGPAFAPPPPASPALAALGACEVASTGWRRLDKPMRRDLDATRRRVLFGVAMLRGLLPGVRLPDFGSQFPDATMPEGSFFLPEFEDHDDHTTGMLASAVEPDLGPLIPTVEWNVITVRGLEEAAAAGPAGLLFEGNRKPSECHEEADWHRPDFATPEELKSGLAPEDYEFQGNGTSSKGQVWSALRDAWRGASGLFKTLVVGIPGLLLAGTLAWGLAGDSLREQVHDRAAILIEDDFQSSLEGWFGARDWSQQWKREPDGFVSVGALALCRSTLKLSDYSLELLGMAERGSLGWVIRAADLSNYYAMKVAIIQAGPMPSLALVRYAVIAGQEGQRVQVPIRAGLHQGRPYKVQVTVAGSGFTTLIDGQVVDYWTDERLKTGGVGFFADGKDDRARVYWMRVAHNNDLLGRICALLAPNG